MKTRIILLAMGLLLAVSGCDSHLDTAPVAPLSDATTVQQPPSEVVLPYEIPFGNLNGPDTTGNLADLATKLKKDAEYGDVKAQIELGRMYFDGSGVPQNWAKAATWYKKAANQGNAKAQFHLGVMHRWNAANSYAESIAHDEVIPKGYSEKSKKMEEQGSNCFRLAYPNIKRLAESGDPEAQFILCRMFMGMLPDIKDKDKAAEWRKKAIENFKKFAELGNAKAQRSLGDVYQIAPVNDTECIRWYTKAAKQKDAIAQYNLGSFYRYKREYSKSIAWLQTAALHGHCKAQDELDEISSFELGSSPEAVEWYKKAAEQGNAVAQYRLAEIYSRGDGVAKDENEAFKWYKKAAEHGYPEAQSLLGGFYQYGLGYNVDKDNQEAFKWYKRAAQQGDVDGQYNLAMMYAEGKGVEKNLQEAFKWYKKAAEQGDRNGQSRLATMYAEGKGVEKNLQKAFKWYKKAAEQGNMGAQYFLGNMYAKGEGIDKNYDKAIECYTKAAQQKNSLIAQYSQYQIGSLYSNVAYTGHNLRKAAKWYEEAAKNNYYLAQYSIAKMYYEGKGVLQNYVEAYMWAILASAKNNRYAGLRENIKKDMTKEQIAEGQKKAIEFYDTQQRKYR